MSVWTKPQYEDVRLGFEINLYVSNRQAKDVILAKSINANDDVYSEDLALAA